MTSPSLRRRALLAATTLPLAVPALAQEGFPNRPLRLIVGFTPGGATDISARAIAPKMGEALGQPVIVENRPGAGSNIATEVVARSPADGHTLLLATLGALVVSPMVMRLPVDPARDLVPISIAVDLFNILVLPMDRPWRSVAELVAAAKAAPGGCPTAPAASPAGRTWRGFCSTAPRASRPPPCTIAAAGSW